jgi:hypothetical protein
VHGEDSRQVAMGLSFQWCSVRVAHGSVTVDCKLQRSLSSDSKL